MSHIRPAGKLAAVRSGLLAGVLLMLAATVMFSLLDFLAKYLSQDHQTIQVAWARYFGHFAIMMLFLWPRRGKALLQTKRFGLQIIRSLLLLLCTVLFFAALAYMPLADAVAISFVTPLIATALSVPFLKERVGWRRWTAIAIGFVGALIIVRPGLGVMHWAAFLVLGVSFFFAIFQLQTKILAATDDSMVTLFYSALVGAAILSFIVPWYWTTPDSWAEILMFMGVGVFGGIGHYFLIKAHEFAPVSILSPLTYASLIWGAILGYLVFRHFPDAATLTGAAILVATGVYIVLRESRSTARKSG